LKWDVKIALYLFLAYALYGISYLFSDGDYVVPLPMLFIFVPIVSLVFFFTSGFNKFSVFFLLLPLVVMSDKMSQFNPGLSGMLVLLSVFSWILLGVLLIFDKNFKKVLQKHKIVLAFPIACLSSLLFLLGDQILTSSIFLLIGVVSSIIIRDDDEKYNLKVHKRRLFILASFISWMYLITVLSVYLA